jgi:predicted ferric reductase
MHAAAALTGIFSLVLWTASFVLMLRLPLLERAAGGLDRLYWWHHVCGVLAYVVLLAHPLALGAAIGAAQGSGWIAAAAVLTPPGASGALRAGWLALALLMAMMLATFWLPLAYSRWRALHLASVPAFALGVVHAWAFAGPGLRALLGALALVSALALGWRYALGRGWVRAHPHRVAKVAHPGPGLLDLELEPVGAPLRWRAGQFVFVAFFKGSDWRGCGEYHPYTIAGDAHPDGRGLRLLIRALGDCTGHLQSVRPGVRALVQGPYGGFLAQRDPARPQLWIAGGIGLTPFLAALRASGRAEGPGSAFTPPAGPAGPGATVPRIDLVHVHRPDDALALECAGEGAEPAPAGVRLHSIKAGDDPDAVWRELLDRVGDPAGRQVFLCGPPPLVDALSARLRDAGVAPQDIHSERFDFR